MRYCEFCLENKTELRRQVQTQNEKLKRKYLLVKRSYRFPDRQLTPVNPHGKSDHDKCCWAPLVATLWKPRLLLIRIERYIRLGVASNGLTMAFKIRRDVDWSYELRRCQRASVIYLRVSAVVVTRPRYVCR